MVEIPQTHVNIRNLLYTIIAVGSCSSALAQSGADTLLTPSDPRTAVTDTVRSPSGLDSLVTYTAEDSVVYLMNQKTMFLHGNGSITYKELGLKAEFIDINWTTANLHATGVLDTTDTGGVKLRGSPDLIDGNETYKGSAVAYNFRTKKGRITVGDTEIESGYYHGEQIKKIGTDVLFVKDGRYTTCELGDPHYYFASPEMKVTVKDKVIARPVYLYISDVPVFALPFGVFPNQRGRRSGIIAPAYGESNRGRYLTHLGYYWAINDHLDMNIRGDGYSKGGWGLYSDFRYARRYTYTGSLSGKIARSITGVRGDPGYSNEELFNLRFAHNHDIDPTMRLVVDFTFSSGSYYQRTSNNLADLLRQNILSNATLTKSWEGTGNSMTVNLRRDQNLQPAPGGVELLEFLPSVGFNKTQNFPFRSAKRAVGSTMQWYELIGYSYGGQFLNRRTKTKLEDGFSRDDRRGVSHSLTSNISPKLGYFTITPFFNYQEKWYDKRIERTFNPVDSSLTTTDVDVITGVRTYDLGLSTGTKLYGIVQPNILGIKGIRHQISPSLSYTYAPDFSEKRFGYYDTFRDEHGKEQRYSRYEREVFGGAPAGERQSLGLGIGNVFEMKTESADSVGKENKFQLLNLNMGLSYNFAADSLRFSELSMDFRTSIGDLLNIGGGARFNLYKFERDPRNPLIGRRVNKFLLSEFGRLAQLTSFNISLGTRLSGEKKETTAGPVRTAEDSLREARGESVYDKDTPDFRIPWNLDLTWNFSQDQHDPRVKTRRSTIGFALGFNLTEFWKINASGSYDVLNKQFAAPLITIYRDLHCWEMNFTWTPVGQYRDFRLEIRVKASQLQDVKVTKQESARDIFD